MSTIILRDCLRWGHETLVPFSDSARLDAEILLAHVLGRPVTFLLAHDETPVSRWVLWRYRRLVERRRRHEPVAYLTGHKEFFGLDFKVNRHVLIPRPDTELVVEKALEYLRGLERPALLDVGTGSGCIPISLCKSLPGLRAVGADVSWRALGVAWQNRRRHGVGERLRLTHSDLFLGVRPAWFRGRELVVTANLPYLPAEMSLPPDTHFEPQVALFGGGEGLELYRRFFDQLPLLKPRAVFAELYDFQVAALRAHWERSGYELREIVPMSGMARLIFIENVATSQ